MNYLRWLLTVLLAWGATGPGPAQVTRTANRPEQEHLLLDSLVNKFGDSENKIASLVYYNLILIISELG